MTDAKLFMNFEVTDSSHTLEAYRARGGYKALSKALTKMKPAEVTAEVLASGIQGRGGASFAMGRKWQGINLADGQPHYLCCNADEGEPGTFKDRWILEYAPHQLVESMIIASYALGVRHCYVYIRGEFDLSYRRLQGAVDEAYAAGYLGQRVMNTGYALDFVVYRGAGAYVCGEASGLVASIEGKKGYPRNRPPRTTVKGLYRLPTVVNNVETLANVSWIVNNGGAEYRKIGTAKSPGTHLISISGHIVKPGVYEREFGYPFDKFVYEDCGGTDEGAPARGDRRAAHGSRVARRQGFVAGVRRHDRDRRGHVHGAAAAGDAALLQPRVVRPVHAVPRGHGLDAPHHQPHRGRPRAAGRHRQARRRLAFQRRDDDLRARRCGRLRDRRDPGQVPGRVRALHRAREISVRRETGMPRIFLNDSPVEVAEGTTVLRAALDNGVERVMALMNLLVWSAPAWRSSPTSTRRWPRSARR